MHKVITCYEYTRVKRLYAEVGLEAIVEGLSEHVSEWIAINEQVRLKHIFRKTKQHITGAKCAGDVSGEQ